MKLRTKLEDEFLAYWRMLDRERYDKLDFPEPEREFRFHFSRLWKFDFCWPDALVAVEIEGGLWMPKGGGHSHPMHIEKDIEKYNVAAFMGWSVIRLGDVEIKKSPVPTLREIARLIKHRLLDGVTDYPVDSYALRPAKKSRRASPQVRQRSPQPTLPDDLPF
jgi:very-short-patch-repair endonuclease